MDKKTTGQKIIVIVGPTASGKSDLAIKLAKKLGGEIISADSRQVYRGMDIGTGKVTKKEQKIVKHHLIDIISPKNQFTVSEFKRLSEKVLEKLYTQGKVPIIVGGTGLYIDVLTGRMAIAEVPPNKKLRAELEKQTAEQLFKHLEKIDPARAVDIDRHNKRRLIRALEIVVSTKKTIPKNTPINNYQILWLGLRPANLEKRIKDRLNERLEHGMVSETKKLRQNGVTWKRLDDFGLEYRWAARSLKKELAEKEFQENLYKDIVRYSKRQMTWFKKNKEIHWIKNLKEAERLVSNFLRA